ncbi:MAG: hypothetical protein DSM106950_43815 [Stigonema ocellatum SAG 48.90 = DSM 106950]|nr:hypothetical protein [Stigonema ocellatum SAG 48.90 = DSM 106950]
MSIEATSDQIRQKALASLVDNFLKQGHSPEYAQVLAVSTIFQTDLDLRNAQMARLLAWLKQEHHDIYVSALSVVEKTCEEFERRVQQG